MRSKWNSLFVKMMLTFSLLILPLYGLSVWFTNNSSGQMRMEIEHSNESVLLFHYSSLKFELARMTSLMGEYSVDGELADFSTMSSIMTNYEIDQRLNNILLKLRQMKSSSPYIRDVRYYLPSLHKTVSVRSGISDSRSGEWEGIIEGRSDIRGNISVYNGDLLLAKSTPVILNNATTPNFLLVMQLSSEELVRQLKSISKEETGGAFLTFGDSDETVISDRSKQVELPKFNLDPPGHVVRLEKEKGYYYSIRDSSYEFRLISYMTKDVLFEPIHHYTFWMWGLTAVSCLLIVVFSYGIYRLIHKPLFKLIRGFKTVERGDMTSPIVHQRGDEFGYLYSQFNLMQQRLHSLIEENFVQRIRTQDAELRHLQSQITPHFLYNSLFTIKQMAELENIEDIKIFSDYLGQYFRFMTRDFNKEVPLGEEIEHSLVYLQIQEIRFSNRMMIDTDPLPEQYHSIMVPRIILQPIFENVFKHGLAQKATGGILRMSNREEAHFLIIVIEDNGDKLTDETLSGLHSRIEKVSSLDDDGETTGLINVHHRLRIRFGPEFGLRLSRSSLGGLRTEIFLPRQYTKKD